MGIRIHKVLGYGFKYCRFQNDPRFNPWVFDHGHTQHEEHLNQKLIEFYEQKRATNEDKYEFDDFTDYQYLTGTGWCKENGPAENLTAHDFIQSCEFDGERGAGPIIFTSPQNKDWYRYDDIIDYCEADDMDTKVKIIQDGIYPLNCSYVDRRTGKRVKNFIGKYRYKEAYSYSDGITEKFQQDYNVKSFNEYCVNIVPVVPSLIVNFCNVFNVFKNPLTVYRLKPMLLTYWD